MAKKKLKLEKSFLLHDDFLKEVAEKTELKASKVEQVYEVTSDIVERELLQGRKAVVPKLGTFKPSYRAASQQEGVINPKTKELGIKNISEKYGAKFTPKGKYVNNIAEKGKEYLENRLVEG